MFYTGTVPAYSGIALDGTNNVVGTLTFQATPYTGLAHIAGYYIASLQFVLAAFTAVYAGTITFARAYEADGVTSVMDLTVGIAGTDILLTRADAALGSVITIVPPVVRMPGSA